MSQLILVRHGQAAFLSDNYDQLSPLGEEQAELLGDYWTKRNVAFDAFFTGPRKRQIKTGEIVVDRYRKAGLTAPELILLKEFDEYDADGIMKHLLPQLMEQDDRYRQLQSAFAASETSADKHKNFQKLFEAITAKWVRGEVLSPEVEAFADFHTRVRRGLERATTGEGSGRRVAVFSSGGAISVSVQLAAKSPEHVVIEYNWRIRNCSLNEMIFSKDRFSLDSFNAIPHLDDPRLHTYR